jgi:hypothetical protein
MRLTGAISVYVYTHLIAFPSAYILSARIVASVCSLPLTPEWTPLANSWNPPSPPRAARVSTHRAPAGREPSAPDICVSKRVDAVLYRVHTDMSGMGLHGRRQIHWLVEVMPTWKITCS